MIRTIGLLGMAGGFLFISPSIRGSVGEWGLNAQAYLTAHGPYSWAAAGGAALGAIMLLARSARAPR
ncbi:MAG: hypothetical protein ABSC23_15785 [Bryobacteraceae bacterium]|jgi:hypothetical protein